MEELEAWTTELGTDETDLEAACRLARGLLPIEARRRIWDDIGQGSVPPCPQFRRERVWLYAR